jgi:hypothetical protein
MANARTTMERKEKIHRAIHSEMHELGRTWNTKVS